MDSIRPAAEQVAARLIARGETVAVAESSAGGLISAALLATPGASRFFLGGAVIYTRAARAGLLDITAEALTGIRPATEPYALLIARAMRQRVGAVWAIAETGATGPTGNSYGDAPGHACIAIAGPSEKTATLETGDTDRVANMRAFARAAVELLSQQL